MAGIHSSPVSTVLIAASDLLAPLKEDRELRDAMTFADTDALRALEAITRHRPTLIAVEKTFATTTRGSALINRIKADPFLTSCEIRIVSRDRIVREEAPAVEEPPVVRPAAAIDVEPHVGINGVGNSGRIVAVPEEAAPVVYRIKRRAERFPVADNVEVLVDGKPAMLVDLSTLGAQVISPTILKPNQRIRLALPDPSRPLRFSAAVAWAAFEMPQGQTRYRAGIEFFDADPTGLTRFIDANKK